MWCGLVWWMLLLNDCGFKTGVATSVRHPLNTEKKKQPKTGRKEYKIGNYQNLYGQTNYPN